MNLNICGDFQICISVPLIDFLIVVKHYIKIELFTEHIFNKDMDNFMVNILTQTMLHQIF